jgi:hypothetical protein
MAIKHESAGIKHTHTPHQVSHTMMLRYKTSTGTYASQKLGKTEEENI